ncbi:RluA family pseudouridine synthase [Paenibacillus sp. GCM10023252]|uniref:RluA family pseudouridine synthase n=1 Tax=Paenibacillus sp. GCM10023252 TaxID=3252649 RepID=UPI00360C89C0
MLKLEQAKRQGEWLAIPWTEAGSAGAGSAGDTPKAGSHPHLMRQWLLASSLFPDKWVGRLFSVGGIRWEGSSLLLLMFPRANVDKDKLYVLAKQPPAAGSPTVPVLYEDDYCLVLDKPAGMPVHEAFAGQRGTLDEAAARHCMERGDPLPVRHIHRLDEDTSGPVLYAKNDLAQLRLDEAMREKAIDRRYLALVKGHLAKRSGTINLPIGKDRHHRARRIVTPGGDHAVTHYETMEQLYGASLLRVQLETGRTHQIRVHLSHLGHPLIGDGLYGGDTRLLKHQALHGERLLFAHPWTGEQIEVLSPVPEWLQAAMNQLRRF